MALKPAACGRCRSSDTVMGVAHPSYNEDLVYAHVKCNNCGAVLGCCAHGEESAKREVLNKWTSFSKGWLTVI